MFKNLLVPTDGSKASLESIQTVVGLAGSLPDPTVTVVAAINPTDPDRSDLSAETVEKHNTGMRWNAERAIRGALKALEEANVRCSGKVICGDPVSLAIATEATRGDYDLIVMASRGLSLEKDVLNYLGSVTDHVIRRVGIPVLVIPVREVDG